MKDTGIKKQVKHHWKRMQQEITKPFDPEQSTMSVVNVMMCLAPQPTFSTQPYLDLYIHSRNWYNGYAVNTNLFITPAKTVSFVRSNLGQLTA